MILIVNSWACTLCHHSKTFDPALTTPPEICPACNNGKQKEAFKLYVCKCIGRTPSDAANNCLVCGGYQ